MHFPINYDAMTPDQQYAYHLKNHDWLYEFSDDYSVFNKGQRERNAILKMAKLLDPDLTIYKQYEITPFDEAKS